MNNNDGITKMYKMYISDTNAQSIWLQQNIDNIRALDIN